MKVFIPVYGTEYLNFLDQGLLPSLSWPRNRKALGDAHFYTWTNCPDKFRGFTLLEGSMHDALIQMITICLRDKEPLLIACPDFIFSEGSIQVLRSFAKTPGTCVGFPHMRVNASFLEHSPLDPAFPLSGPQLLTRAIPHAHRSFREAECVHPHTNCYNSGISWRRDHSTLLIQHRLPSAFVVNFLPEDLSFFENERFDSWDHRWPASWKTPRSRIIGSNDAAFMVELTGQEIGSPRLSETNVEEPDEYRENLPHHEINRQFISVWRMG